ncbi:hypothetical protein N9E38_00515 [Yoonia sp.]|nr:hypothetical protein [Yoonia sp.]
MTTMTISKELLDELLSGVENATDLLGDKGLMKELKVRLMERMLGADLSRHPQFREGWQMRQRMGCRTKPVRYPISRTVQQMTRQTSMG